MRFRHIGISALVWAIAAASAVAVPIAASSAAASTIGRVSASAVMAVGPRSVSRGGPSAALVSVSCPAISACYALYYRADSSGSSNMLLSTVDGGRAWRKTNLPTAGGGVLTSMACPVARTCYGVGTGSIIMATTDGGQTWRQQRDLAGEGTHLTSVACPNVTVCYAVGEGGTIVDTIDGGRRAWTSQDSGTQQDLASVACPTVKACYAVGSGGMIVATADGGATWTRQTAPGSAAVAALFSIGCADARACVVGGQYGLTLGTANGGHTWRVNNAGTDSLYGVACPGPRACYAAGRTGGLAVTHDAAATWSTLPGGTHRDLASIACPTTATCYAVGDGAVIVATTDGGRVWRAQSNPLGGTAAGGVTPGRDTGAPGGPAALGAATAVQAVGMVVVRGNNNPSKSDLGAGGIVPCSPGQGANGVVYTRDTGCPITARLEARLQQILSGPRGRAADPICGCQNVSRLRVVLSDSTASLAHVSVTWLDFGPSYTRVFVVLKRSGRWLVDDEYPAGRPDKDIYHSV